MPRSKSEPVDKVVGEEISNIPTPAPVGQPARIPVSVVYDRYWSINMAATDWIELPVSHVVVNRANPTIFPKSDEIGIEDAQCLVKLILVKKLIPGARPAEKVTKRVQVLESYLNSLKSQDFEQIRDKVGKIIEGPNTQGGYNRMELLQAMYDLEKLGSGGGRKQVLSLLSEGIAYVESFYGLPKVTEEDANIEVTFQGSPPSAAKEVSPDSMDKILNRFK